MPRPRAANTAHVPDASEMPRVDSRLADVPDVRDTEESRIYATPPVIENGEKLLVNGQTIEHLPPGTDRFALSDRRKAELGITSDEYHLWVLDTRSNGPWADHSPGDRIEEAMDNGARLILDNGKPVKIHDTILMAAPKTVREEWEKREARALSDYVSMIQEEISYDDHGRPIPKKTDDLEALRNQNSDLYRTGEIFQQSDTKGLSFRQAMMSRTEADLEQEQAYLRRGGRVVDEPSVQNGLDRAVESAKSGVKGRSQFGQLTGKMDNWERSGDRRKAASK